jgi:phosphatidylserine/phosphatidylglycerophosphate/cardiolipin synthase-like enzyme
MLDLSDALASGRLNPPYSAIRIAGYVPEAVADDVGADLARMNTAGMQPAHIAECLQLLATEREANQQTVDRLQLVWTGPDVPGSVSRDTGVVMKELFTSARRAVLLSSFTVRRGNEVFAPLAEAVGRNPSLDVRLAVNVGRDGDFATPQHQILTRFAEGFWQNHWPWQKRPCVYYDPRALSTDPAICASLHAKCIVIDDEIAFVTSANFTEWAQERNLEAGVLIRDESFARSLKNQFESLIVASRLRLLPGSAGSDGSAA